MLRWIGAMLLMSLIVSGCQSNPGSAPDGDGKRQAAQTVNDMRTGNVNEALWKAAEQGDSKAILESLNAGAEINATDDRERTAAMIAVHANRIEVFKVLVDQGADINIRDNRSDNPLLYAGAEGLLPFVQAAVAAGADTKLTNRFGGTALIPAADRGHVEIVKELLTTSDVDINHVNNLGWTALLEAVILGDGGSRHQAIVDLLIEHGADVNLADSDSVTPLQHAKKRGFEEMIRSLEQAGAK
ncbi:ankyrin repeat domain-containing protein [Paenibacillus sp. LHD-117]|uniref:ankyrin repeat domain-containing protein n=1 Tax=Paenibacillus sp. LHD-117 TaxID=3071412 RepID=UPI0027DEF241|nr:ankyrin repeat domain-containing protein [Paenibacillus sp. LHD-117]MDQ6422429.1 ankyrin repeat domain-containing protein [Paenibacillus sp. LHD-117]